MNNKTITVFIMLMLFFQGIGTAQFSVSIVGGVNTSSVIRNGQPFGSEKFAHGYFIGFVPTLPIGNNFQVTLDFLYSKKGYKDKFNDFINFTVTRTHSRISYFDFIPEIEYKVCRFLNIGTGFNFAKLIGTELKSNDEDFEEQVLPIKKFDFGWTAKIGGSIKNINYFFRYNQGFINTSLFRLPNAAQRNSNVQVGVGYNFKL